MTKGWKQESARHALAAKGIETGKRFLNDVVSGVLIFPYGTYGAILSNKIDALEYKIEHTKNKAKIKEYTEKLKQANKQFNGWYKSAKKHGLVA